MCQAFASARFGACLLLLVALGAPGRLLADDTDIYLNPSVPTGSEPLVMFVLDWRPNLGATVACPVGSYCAQLRTDGYLADGKTAASGSATTFFDMLRAVLKKVLDPLGGVKIGFMLNHQDKQGCEGFPPKAKCSNGAYIPFGFETMVEGSDNEAIFDTAGEDANKLELFQLLADIPMPGGNQSHPFQGKELYFELFRYLTGQGVYNGHNGIIDFGDSPNDTKNLDVDRPALMWDTDIETSSGGTTRYVSPLGAGAACSKIYVINLMFQVSQQEDNSDTAIKATKAAGGMAGISLSGSTNNFPTVIEYLNDADLGDGSFGTVGAIDGVQNVVSYFIVDPTKINTTTTAYAQAGGTGVPLPLSEDPQVLVDTLNGIFKSILSVSTTFVAPSVPVNVFNRAQIVNEVFLALFEADADGRPFWPGNLKKLKIGLNETTSVPELRDANDLNAIDIDGRIKREAVTFWTDPATLPAPTSTEEVDGADGRAIKRGGAGQQVPGFATGAPELLNSTTGARQLFTENPAGTGNKLLALNADATTASALWTELKAQWTPATSAATYAAATTAEQQRAQLALRYLRGYAGVTFADSTTERDWFMGDPLHSRPRPVNYGARGSFTAENPDIRILMATTDGVLHMFRNTAADGSQDGGEAWAFAPRAALPLQDRLRQGAAGTPVHPIGLDGSPVVFQKDVNFDGTIDASDGDFVWMFVGQRRGGKAYYALDITDPDAPRFMWKIDKATSGFGELAQTWSSPATGMLKFGVSPRPVLIFGGGYNGDDGGDNAGDLGKDAANRNGATGTDDDEGNAVFIVDAETGALVWKAVKGASIAYSSGSLTFTHTDLADSIPSELAAVDMDGDGLIDRLYFGDTGGRVWRGDLAGDDRANWGLSVLANVGRHYDDAASNDLRFFNRPDIVATRDIDGAYDAVLIGSGDRENPLDTEVQNWFFAIKDRNVQSGTPPATSKVPTDFADLSVDCFATDSCEETTLDKLTDTGWRISLVDPGEKNLATAITSGGKVFFTTFVPSAPVGNCGLSEGTGYQYAVSLQQGEPVFNYNLANDLDGITLDRRDQLASGGIPVEVVPIGDDYVLVQGQETGQNIQTVQGRSNWRTFWYEVPR